MFRYTDILEDKHLEPNDILMLTFTENAAEEMSERIKVEMERQHKDRDKKKVLAMTFDSFFHSIVMENAEFVGDFFWIKKKMTRSARLITNKTVNSLYFQRFYEEFMDRNGQGYGDVAIILANEHEAMYDLIRRLMSKGVIPTADGWFGYKWREALFGREELMDDLEPLIGTELLKVIDKDDEYVQDFTGKTITEKMVGDAILGGREPLINLVHDVYLGYIERSITDNRLTFELNSMFAFTLLYSKKAVRDKHKFRYVMIDEFQDTDAKQLMVALMLLKEDCPNLCVVGDWKQGIYGFRYVSVENIKYFESRVGELHAFLNHDCPEGRRAEFEMDPSLVKEIVFNENFRSTDEIVQKAYDAMSAKATGEDPIEPDIEDLIKRITAKNKNYAKMRGGLRFVQAADKDDEAQQVVRAVRDYADGKHVFFDDDDKRTLGLRDICVLCRTVAKCRTVADALREDGIPVYLQGEVELMATREGKLALAWLRYVMNENDPSGVYTIMLDLGYPMMRVWEEKDRRDRGEKDTIPVELKDQRMRLIRSSRRIPSMMTQLFGFYGDLDQDIVQAIVSNVSSSHRGSLLTIADIVSMIEEDIVRRTKYEIEDNIDRDAVRVMTMHKSKGMEFGAVIIPYFDQGSMPRFSSGNTGRKKFLHYSELVGVRCLYEMAENNGYRKIVSSWSSALVRAVEHPCYDEERRLLFVSLSRAKMYETLICGPKPCMMLDRLMKGYEFVEIPEIPRRRFDDDKEPSAVPEIPPYEKRVVKMPVHDIMRLRYSYSGEERSDEMGGKGMAYGTEVHKDAEMLKRGREPDNPKPEHAYIRKVLGDVESRGHMYVYEAEMDCQLPIKNQNVMLRGTIDLISGYGDHVEIHDWKTDSKMDPKVLEEYKLQLSVYAQAAKGCYGTDDVRCYIHYVSLGETVPFEPMGMDKIEERVRETLIARGEAEIE